MTIRDRLKSMLDPTDARFETGDEESRRQAREEWRRDRLVGQVLSSPLTEIDRDGLVFHRFGRIENRADGRLYQRHTSQLVDLEYVPDAIAYYVDETGFPHLLLRPVGPESVQALAEEQAEQERRRNLPRPRPAWMTARR